MYGGLPKGQDIFGFLHPPCHNPAGTPGRKYLTPQFPGFTACNLKGDRGGMRNAWYHRFYDKKPMG